MDEEEDFIKDLLMVLDVHEMDLTLEVEEYEVDLGPYLEAYLKRLKGFSVLTLVPKN